MGVPSGESLIAFADALVGRDDQALAAAREQLRTNLSVAVMIDASGVASNFQRMVRIADGTGIPLDDPMQVMSEDVRADLGINDFVSASNSRGPGPLKRLFLRGVVLPMMRRMIRRESSGRADS